MAMAASRAVCRSAGVAVVSEVLVAKAVVITLWARDFDAGAVGQQMAISPGRVSQPWRTYNTRRLGSAAIRARPARISMVVWPSGPGNVGTVQPQRIVTENLAVGADPQRIADAVANAVRWR